MSKTLHTLLGDVNVKDDSDTDKQIYINRSKEIQARHEHVRNEMIKTLEAMQILEEQYNNYQSELYTLEQQYVDNLKNLIE